ncbi:hypothetical protein Pmani_030933 [Petrolisthes manimaculis]|uniref:Rad21/Rec8-like protein N-terminal domain-containing protein n=2 Tax=Petrolisthes manimaculis TaxID=1843537 RepID=A0AAE1TVE1_9EUCA|nr:hypothetical protein Pmani_030933 [Petrolisthes manimaculis]
MDVVAACNEILCYMNNTGPVASCRFSLYLQCQLLYGTVKLFGHQVAHLLGLAQDLDADVNRTTWKLPVFDAPKTQRSRVTLKETGPSELSTLSLTVLSSSTPRKRPGRKGLKTPSEEQERLRSREIQEELRQTEERPDNITLAVLEGDWLISHQHIHSDPSSVTMLDDHMFAEKHEELLASQIEAINEDFGLMSKELGPSKTIDTLDMDGEDRLMDVEKDVEERVERRQLSESRLGW